MAIFFFNEDINYKLHQKRKIKEWIKDVIVYYGFKLGEINYIFCSDNHILTINNSFLSHNYYTDVITFPYTINNVLAADIYISVETVSSNSKKYHQNFEEELYRVIIHGILHLVGFNDQTESQKNLMREKENEFISKLRKDYL